MTEDPRIMLRGVLVDDGTDLMVDHPQQTADYLHAHGTLWTWQGRWRIVGGFRVEGPASRWHAHSSLRPRDRVASLSSL